MPLKIATWNINSVRLRIGIVEKFLQQHQPDILCLQEIKCQNDQFPAKNFRKLGYEHMAVNGQKGYHGVATVSKIEFSDALNLQFCESGDSRHQAIIVPTKAGDICLHNFYVPAGGDIPDPDTNPKFEHKLQFVNAMLNLKSDHFGFHNVLVGDLNIAPHENDVWSHKQLLKIVSHTPVETELLDRVRNEGQWEDLIRAKIPYEEKIFSWWSYRAKDWSQSDRGRRLDHIWSNKELKTRLRDISLLRDLRGWEKPSDHIPIIATFDVE